MAMTEEEKTALGAYRLINEHGGLISGVLSHLMQTEMQTIIGSQPEEAGKREVAYQRITAIKDIDAFLRNLAAQHKPSNKPAV